MKVEDLEEEQQDEEEEEVLVKKAHKPANGNSNSAYQNGHGDLPSDITYSPLFIFIPFHPIITKQEIFRCLEDFA